MNKFITSFLFSSIASVSILSVSFAALPITIMHSKSFKGFASPFVVKQLVKQHVIPEINQADVLKIQVKPIYKNHQVDALMVYVLSNKTFSFKKMRVDVDQQMKFMAISSVPANDDNTLSPQEDDMPGVCPDSQVDFVVASPLYSEIDSTKSALDHIAKLATAKGYHVVQLFDRKATVQNYKDYLNCPNLKGFVSVGHGAPEEILLDDDVLTGDYFRIYKHKETKALSNAVVEFNSCEVFNLPLSYDMINFAGVKNFLGGNTSLVIGHSERASQCFWTKALEGHDLADSLETCENLFDADDSEFGYGRDIFGFGGFGQDYLAKPNSAH